MRNSEYFDVDFPIRKISLNRAEYDYDEYYCYVDHVYDIIEHAGFFDSHYEQSF